MGQRIEQTVGANVTQYTLDVALPLWEVLAATTGANTSFHVHDPLGLLEQQDAGGIDWMLADGLGSLRGVVNGTLTPLESRLYAPYGEPTQLSGSSQSSYGFTGESTDANGLVHLRARY